MAEVNPDVKRIADRLNETNDMPLTQIENIINVCGVEFADLMVENAILIEENGGLMTADEFRRRSLGGVFFHLVRRSLTKDLHDEIFPPPIWMRNKDDEDDKPSPYPPFDWDDRVEQLQKVFEEQKTGKVIEVNIQIKGRPEHVEKRDGVYVVSMEMKIPDNQTFPKGVPTPPNEATKYIAFIGEEQWQKKVDTALEDKKIYLIINGAGHYDNELGGVVVFTRGVQTKKYKDIKPKEKQEPKKPAEKKPKSDKVEFKQVKTPPKDEEAAKLAEMPDDIAQKLRPLYGARKLFRKRLADIEALPEDKQSGLQAARMMLERTQKQIDRLEKQAEENNS